MANSFQYRVSAAVIRRISLAALLLVIALLLTGIAASQWLLRTEAGAAWLWSRAESALAPNLGAERVEGTIRRGLRIDGLRYDGPGAGIDAGRIAVSFDPDLWPLGLTVDGLSVEGARVRLRPATEPDESSPAPSLRDIFSAMRLPVDVRARNLWLVDTRIIAADGTELLALDELKLGAALGDRLVIDTLQATVAGSELRLDGELALEAPYAVDASIRASTTLSPEDEAVPLQVALKLDGDLSRLQAELQSERPSLTVSGSVRDVDVDSEPTFDLAGGSSGLRWPIGSDNALVTLSNLEISVTGRPSDYAVAFRTALTTDSTGPLQLDGDVEGDLRGLQVSRLDVRSADIDADVRGEFGWADGLSADADITLARLAPARWIGEWPAEQTVSGQLAGRYAANGIDLRNLRLSLDGTDARIAGRGTIDVERESVDIAFEWQNLQWPLAPATPTIDSRDASLTVSGRLDDWQLAGDVALGAPDLPQGTFALKGGGTRDEVALEITDSAILGGRLTGTLAFNWRDAQPWSAALQSSGVSITPFAPQWPGRLSASFQAEGELQPLSVFIDIDSLEGEIRSRPVSASGEMQFANGVLRANELTLQSADSSLLLDGSPLADDGLRFELSVASLADLMPGSAGTLEARGSVVQREPLPLITLEASAADLAWQGLRAGQVTLANSAIDAGEPFALALAIEDAVAGQRAYDRVDVQLNGDLSSHRLSLAVASGELAMDAAFQGAAVHVAGDSAPAWSGSVETFSLSRDDALGLTLREPAQIEAAALAVSVTRACVDTSRGGTLCTGGEWAGDDGFAARVEMNALPLDLLRLFVASELEFTQTLDGTVELAAGADSRLTGSGRIDIAPGEIRNQFDERLTLRTRAGLAAFELQDGQLLSGEISLPFSDAAEISGNFSVADVALGQDSPVSGQLRANVRNIGVGARIIPMIDDAGGRLEAEFRASGTLAAPVFDGGLTLRDGHFAYDPLGFRIDDLQVDGQVLPGNRVELQSTFRAGEGRAELSSSADYLGGQSPGFEMALNGSRLTLIDLDDLRVVIDPDVQLGVSDGNVRINGRVVMPEARLASINLVNGGVSESDDVVMVGDSSGAGSDAGDDSGSESGDASAEPPLQFGGTVELVLGDNVAIDLDLAEAQLRGSTRFTWAGPSMPQATGGFDVSGKFQAYGQLLEITEGIIRFPGVPASNPELRIRAEREIFGNSQVRNAGVLVSGTAERPQVDVYTTPATSKDRALTLLATGSDFDYEQGVGAVDVGTYIAPKLYASYGIGLFDKENVISVRYDLAKGFGIKATSGKRAAGIDISYTIER